MTGDGRKDIVVARRPEVQDRLYATPPRASGSTASPDTAVARSRLRLSNRQLRDAVAAWADLPEVEQAMVVHGLIVTRSIRCAAPAPQKGSPPVWKKRLFSNGSFVECAVFRTEVDRGQQSFAAFDVVLDRSYRDGDGKWHTSHSLRRDDLLVAAHVLQRAYAWISDQEKS